ncbi:solute carrier family 23 member 2-like isoform X2 [Physella acuta]|nr:solute carrier family 23 member 2-like isoform X2 [Physella acuta]
MGTNNNDTSKQNGQLDNQSGTTLDMDVKVPTLTYKLTDTPPVVVTLMAALQHILLSVSGCLVTSAIVSDVACIPFDHFMRSELFCTTMFMVGFCTLLQTFFGVRLPIFQGPSSSFVVPLLALSRDPSWMCPKAGPNVLLGNSTNGTNITTGQVEEDTISGIRWRLQEMSGALMLASVFEISLGAFGLLGVLLKYIGPITIANTISLIGVSLYRLPIIYGRPNFIIALSCAILVLIFILYFNKIGIPMPRIGKENKNKPRSKFKIFQLIPILLAVIIVWIVTAILTACDVFTDNREDVGYMARADAKLDIIYTSSWLHVTYPGQFGVPKLSLALTLGFLVACLSSVVESVGDYYAAQKACEIPSIPDSAISRGILMEGIGSIISGAVGAGHATTSYSGNIALLTLSKTGSRSVMYAAGFIILIVSFIGKAGAALTTIPNPILGGVMLVIISTLLSIGLANLKYVDMTTSRNLLVFGLPFMAGIVVPAGIEMHPSLMKTGSDDADRIIYVIFGTPMFLGGILALILDNTVPGTPESRGMTTWTSHADLGKSTSSADVEQLFSWSWYPRLLKVAPFLPKIPFMPKKVCENKLFANCSGEDLELHT